MSGSAKNGAKDVSLDRFSLFEPDYRIYRPRYLVPKIIHNHLDEKLN
jgi:hypothetical protein